MTPILLTVLVTGCAKTTTGNYCDIASPLYFDSDEVVTFLAENDVMLLREIVIANEQWTALCGGKISRS